MSTTAFPKVLSTVKMSLGNNRFNQADRLLLQAILGLLCWAAFPSVYCVCVQNTPRKFPLTARTGSLIKTEMQEQPTFSLNPFRNFLSLSLSPDESNCPRADRPASNYVLSSEITRTLLPGQGCPSFLEGLEPGAGELTSLSLWCK